MVKNKAQKARFGVVGVVNTAIDFGILFVLHAAGLPSVVANFISTTTAFSFSFVANRSYTFRAARSGNAIHRQIILFLVVTLFGLWVIQPIIIYCSELVLASHVAAPGLSLLIAKLAATAVTLVWNYILYEKVVFYKQAD